MELVMRAILGTALSLALALPAAAQPLSADRQGLRDTYKELIETNTTLSSGDCTLAAQRMAARLKAAGYPDGDVQVIVTDGHAKEGALFAVLPGRDAKKKAELLLAHLDVVVVWCVVWLCVLFFLVVVVGFF